MGDYIRHEPDEKQLEAAKYLLAYGITNKHLALDYKLIAQNQVITNYIQMYHLYSYLVFIISTIYAKR